MLELPFVTTKVYSNNASLGRGSIRGHRLDHLRDAAGPAQDFPRAGGTSRNARAAQAAAGARNRKIRPRIRPGGAGAGLGNFRTDLKAQAAANAAPLKPHEFGMGR